MRSVHEVNLKGKTVLLRVDLNSTVFEGRLEMNARIREHAKSIYQLSESGARTVVLAHQGRKGDADFLGLQAHAKLMEKFLEKPVPVVEWETDYPKQIRQLKDGEIVLMQNVRFNEAETEEKTPAEHAKTEFIKKLATVSDYFVQDALSVCHRSHASVVGFATLKLCLAGPVLERELHALHKIAHDPESKLLVLGGGKPRDSLKILQNMLKNGQAREACLGGMIGEIFLLAQGKKLGKKEAFFKEKGLSELVPKAREILNQYGKQITLPTDLAFEKNGQRMEAAMEAVPADAMTKDIGAHTMDAFKQKIRSAPITVFNGPMGVYEETLFRSGTKKVLFSIAFSGTFSILGGGDTEKALDAIGLNAQDFNHVSLAGKALLDYLAGERLPGLEILN
ncbi:MAG: phosphoglycerate kinase [Candidatus Diapherotrites archaeon]|nr:phosphoglycerate kinase [Candidatus Diapherotrites archaeon]